MANRGEGCPCGTVPIDDKYERLRAVSCADVLTGSALSTDEHADPQGYRFPDDRDGDASSSRRILSHVRKGVAWRVQGSHRSWRKHTATAAQCRKSTASAARQRRRLSPGRESPVVLEAVPGRSLEVPDATTPPWFAGHTAVRHPRPSWSSSPPETSCSHFRLARIGAFRQ